MTPTRIRVSVVTERVAWTLQMISHAKDLPLESFEVFLEDSRNAGAAESYLRRSIEALLDIGRHTLAKGFAIAVSEYKEHRDAHKLIQILPPEMQGAQSFFFKNFFSAVLCVDK